MLRACITWILVLGFLVGASGCATTRQTSFRPVASVSETGHVFCADGAGGTHATSAALARAVNDAGLPLGVEAVAWSHGRFRNLADQIDLAHARVEGRRLARNVAAYRCAYPHNRVFLVGHSAGTMVVLAALEELPPASVDRAVLLAPSVSASYDLRGALRAAPGGIDVYCSVQDRFYLGTVTDVIGTADRRWAATSGRIGFRPIVESAEDAALYAKLRQHPWDPCVAWTGSLGGHFDTYRSSYLRGYILPLLTSSGR